MDPYIDQLDTRLVRSFESVSCNARAKSFGLLRGLRGAFTGVGRAYSDPFFVACLTYILEFMVRYGNIYPRFY